MTARRVVIVVTGLAVAATGGLLAMTKSSWTATVLSALAAVAAVGVAVWAALPGSSSRPETSIRVSGSGPARSGPGGSANTGLTGPVTGLRGSMDVERSGAADASDGGNASSGINLT
ncbi:hypothetical protein AB0I98_36935 [Streptomyces sp. NPDC050211]|uniref:hypothetical protein n=1 Tax=Streptomyces sp. NPDC050211 TaxID=3154932 RepID=UPI00343994C5